MLNGSGEDMHGERSMSMGGAILLPFAGHLTGRPGAQPGLLDAVWQGQTLHFPALVEGGTSSVDGLFLDRASSSARSDVLPDGQFAQAVYRSAFAEGWPSTIEVTVTAELSAHTLDLTLTAVNKGKDPAPMGMGWHPVFQIPSGHRADAMLRIPSRTVIAIDRSTGLPTGKTVSTGGSGTDLSRAGGVRLGSQDIDATFTQLETDAVSPYPVAELLDPEYNLSLRVVPMTANLSHLYVSAPATRKSVSIGPASNVPDAFGPEWTPQQSGMIQLAPGATAQWKIRIEVSSIVSGEDRVR
jgi:galactose mutarotase-like enzyme